MNKIELCSTETKSRICDKCKENLPISAFQDKGRWNLCRKCNRERSLKYYHENKAQLNASKTCEICNSICKHRTDYYRHIKTREHLEALNSSRDFTLKF